MGRPNPLIRVLVIDLARRAFRVEDRTGLFQDGLGGTGVAIRLLEEFCPPGADPTGPDNPIILAVGPLVGLFPLAAKTVAMFKSPLTGNLGESHAGGRSAVALRQAGYGAVVIHGHSPSPVYLVIDETGVTFRDASALWGLRNSTTAAAVIRQREGGAGDRSILRIGRAGERGVAYACVTTETYRHFGRLGLGAVFGHKQLKAILIRGRQRLPVTDPRAYRRLYDALHQAAVESEAMRKYHELGTAINVLPLDAIGALPTRNLQSGRFEGASALSGERLATDFLGRRVACSHCPVACIHLAAVRTPYPDDRYFFKTRMIGYDHEPIFAMGSMLGVSDPAAMLHLLDEAEIHGLDVMSTGVTLAWATEAMQRGVVGTAETAGLTLRFGDADAYTQAMEHIVTPPTPFYEALAGGVERAATLYGGQEYALAFGGNEMPGYHTGPGGHLGYLTGARHSHLDSAGYALDQAAARDGRPLTPEGLAAALLAEEQWRQVLTSLVICLFARGLYPLERVREALAVAGFDRSADDLAAIGRDTLRRKHAFKRREGFSFDTLRIPSRIFETPSPAGIFDEDFLRAAIRRYADGL